jgi:hypothetical protein
MPKFIFEKTHISDDQIIYLDYTPFEYTDYHKIFEWKDLIFDVRVNFMHYLVEGLDNLYLSVSAHPSSENWEQKYNLDYKFLIKENRKSGKEKLYHATGMIEVFNGFDDPISLPIKSLFLEKSGSEDIYHLVFPNDVFTDEFARGSYGIVIPKKYILRNMMSVYKITIKFSDMS